VNESIRTSLEAAKRLAEEEAEYIRRVFDAEQAMIAAEAELKRRVDEEALKVSLLQIWLINKDFTSGEEISDMKRNMKYVLHLV
jgi:hypothetical protein